MKRKSTRAESVTRELSRGYACLYGALLGIVTAIGAAIVIAAVLYFSDLPGSAMRAGGYVAVAVGGFFCGLTASGKAGKNGLLCGAISGLLMSALLYLCGAAVSGTLSGLFHSWGTALIATAVSALGGILGVGRKK